MKKILTLVFWVALVALVTSLFIFANAKQDSLVCPEFEIVVDYNHAPALITQSDIRQEITREKIRVRGNEIGDIESVKIQKLLNRNPYIKEATITIGVNGKVKAHILQRNPVVRVSDMNGTQFYMDNEGFVMPLSSEYAARVVIANGHIKPIKKIRGLQSDDAGKKAYQQLPADLQKIYIASMAVQRDSFTNAMVEQIYLNNTGDLELIPKIGRQTIVLGDTVEILSKLSKLKTFYTQGMKQNAWTQYKEINLKYRNQVVCTKSL